MNSSSSEASIEIENISYQLVSIDEYSFTAEIDLPVGIRSHGMLTLGTDNLAVAFRVRETKDGVAKCSFANLSLTNTATIKNYLRKRQRGFIENTLESRSYDELAQGLPSDMPMSDEQANTFETPHVVSASTTNEIGSQATSKIPNTPNTTKSQSHSSGANQKSIARSGIRSMAMLLMMFAMVGLGILAIYFLRSRSTISIANSALVGNYLPVNVKAEGEVIDLFVGEGDAVKAGDVLMQLKNPAMQSERAQCAARLATAKSKVATLKKQLATTKKRVKIAGKKLALDLTVAKSEMESADKLLEVAKINFERLKPALESGAVTENEFELVRQELLAAESNKTVAENAAKQIEFAQNSLKDNVLILGDRFDDEIGRLVAELEIAEAEREEFQKTLNIVNEQFQNLDVIAPRDGSVYVVYRHVGEFVKVADEMIGLSYEGKVWAAGQVGVGQSRRVRCGQPVVVTAPALGKKFDGVVSAVGHRALYSAGRYSADFRGETATDVPVKVIIQDLPDNVPSGTRLEMTINTGFGVEWLDRSMGYSLRSVVTGKPINEIQQHETNTEETDNDNTKDTDDTKKVIGEVAADL